MGHDLSLGYYLIVKRFSDRIIIVRATFNDL